MSLKNTCINTNSNLNDTVTRFQLCDDQDTHNCRKDLEEEEEGKGREEGRRKGRQKVERVGIKIRKGEEVYTSGAKRKRRREKRKEGGNGGE